MGRKATVELDYTTISPVDRYIEPQKQAAKRHYGSHQFFTKRAWNVVQEYIENFSREGDVVLDPFGGSGVTAVEALILARRAVHVDISPLSVFLADSVAVSPVNLNHLSDAFRILEDQCLPKLRQWGEASNKRLDRVPIEWWYPVDYPLPKNADREYVHELFTRRQLLSLAFLLHHVKLIENPRVRQMMLYNFAATLYKCNLTFLSAQGRKESRGGSSIFSIYRYKVAAEPVELDVWEQFRLRFSRLLACKQETNLLIGEAYGKKNNFVCRRGSATALTKLVRPRSIDYIFTDPPYGSHIAYLDLSAIWNAWLGFKVSPSDYKSEIIEGGDLDKSKDDYFALLDASFGEMFRVLKYDRWLSVVFAHKDPAYWDAVVKSATHHGFQYVNTCVQPQNVVWSMHKKKNPLTVLSGEMILNFLKVRNPITIAITSIGTEVIDIIRNVAELVIVRRDGATTDDIYSELIPKLLENGLLGEVKKQVSDITPILKGTFDYDDRENKWRIRPNTRLGSAIPLEHRIRFYVLDFLRRSKRLNQKVTFDDIVQNVMPNLVNGEQPTKQSILEELRKVSIPDEEKKHWILADHTQRQIELDLLPGDHSGLPAITVEDESLTHNDLIVMLARIASLSGLMSVVGKKEMGSEVMAEMVSEITSPDGVQIADEYDRGRVGQIDCVWLSKGFPRVAFEVEMSTSITSALERFHSLLKHFPELAGHLILVVPGQRRRKLNSVLFRSAYVGHPLFMENKVRYLYVSDFVALYRDFAKRASLDEKSAIRLVDSYIKSPDSLR